ncbi:polyisoprenoid-binding protein YceI [Prosthecobacter fusiformis]|uniref:Polyisoprenoid-binding protein YceI n=1 Tax=Prosthecobacter fusiformis TaxID=48464 RepID=A0A4R7SNT8_9BACT|nr:YceI family protein [Prosthecobacter fusiformis]TDU80850.1 polyisoprenoid-binding protein YceI [Prosthecobacter fusiformis]
MPTTLLTADELQALRLQKPELIILDVRLQEDHERRAIAGSVNNCVYEVAFPERLPSLIPALDTPVCVYGESGASHEARVAEEKLVRAGYTQVHRLNGCLAGWCAAGLPEQGTGAAPEVPALPSGHLTMDVNESRAEWLGRNLLNKHWGRVPITAGYLDVEKGEIQGGEFVLSIADITCDDLAGNPYHDVLIAHLRSDDFFDTVLYPEARLKLTRATRIPDAAPGTQNLQVEADLTLRGITAPITFSLSAGMDDKGRCAAQAAFNIDRTRWGVLYGSGSFFHRLAGHLVNDLIELQVRIVMEAA